jgi:hypothetical protein
VELSVGVAMVGWSILAVVDNIYDSTSDGVTLALQVRCEFRDELSAVGQVWVLSPEVEDVIDDGTLEAAGRLGRCGC